MLKKKIATTYDGTANPQATPAIMLYANMPSLEDAAGRTIPAGLPMVVDAHVHVFPDHMFDAVRRWFDDNASNATTTSGLTRPWC